MIKALSSPAIQEFIDNSIGKDIRTLALQKNPFPAVDWTTILQQIESKTKAKDKLPTWFATNAIIYPPKLNIEQTSSEQTAMYKANLVSGKSLVDLTGGFGVDAYYFAKKMKNVTHCEINDGLSEMVYHNMKLLQSDTVAIFKGDSLNFLKASNQSFDWIYIDPSRRNDAKGKVFLLTDCLPNVPEHLEYYFTKTNSILLKTAPILDITAGLSELNCVKEIHIVAVDNEVKELLWVLEKGYCADTVIKTVNFTKNGTEKLDFLRSVNHVSTYNLPEKYLFEPNAAIMKSGGFDVVSAHYQLKKLHQHTHLYTHNKVLEFSGRIFEIKNSIAYSNATMKKYLEGKKANITTRNFPISVELIRKKWKISDGGELYCFFTTDLFNNKIVLLCTKLN